MLGYFGIYSKIGSSWFPKAAGQNRKPWFLLGIQPHDIAMLNAASYARKAAKAKQSVPVEERRAA